MAEPSAATSGPLDPGGGDLPGWLTEAVLEGGQPQQQALALIGLSVMHRLAANQDTPWSWRQEGEAEQADARALRQRLESIDLAIRTGAPLSTAEVTLLLGARPGANVIERGGLQARRLNRNVWVLRRTDGNSSQTSSFHDGRRRF
ncbi:MAG: hypothetical protein ACKOCM_07030 [Cyanobacteriota bacterium]